MAAPRTQPDAEGDRFDANTIVAHRYRVLAYCGDRGFGQVYEAEDTAMEARVALMRLDREFSRPEVRERFYDTRSAAQVGHDKVVDLADYGEDVDGRLFMVMPWVEDAVALDELLAAEAPLPWDRARKLLMQIGEALAAAHEQGVLHGALEPSRILVDKHDGVHMVDFGLAPALTVDSGPRPKPSRSQITNTRALPGNPRYLAPEQVRGESVDVRTDVYAFGVMIWELIAGDPPFTGEPVDVLQAQLDRSLPELSRPRGAPAEIEALLHLALAKDPEDRFASADELLTTLRALASSPGKSGLAKTQLATGAPATKTQLATGAPAKKTQLATSAPGVGAASTRLATGPSPTRKLTARVPPKLERRKPPPSSAKQPSNEPTQAVPSLPQQRKAKAGRRPSNEPTQAVPSLPKQAKAKPKPRRRPPSAEPTAAVPALPQQPGKSSDARPKRRKPREPSAARTQAFTAIPPEQRPPTPVETKQVRPSETKSSPPASPPAPAPSPGPATVVPTPAAEPPPSAATPPKKKRRLGALELALIIFVAFDLLVFAGWKLFISDDTPDDEQIADQADEAREPGEEPTPEHEASEQGEPSDPEPKDDEQSAEPGEREGGSPDDVKAAIAAELPPEPEVPGPVRPMDEKLSDRDFREAMVDAREDIVEACLDTRMRRTLKVSLKVAPNGDVAYARVIGSLNDTALGRCVVDNVYDIEFPATHEGGTHVYTLRLR